MQKDKHRDQIHIEYGPEYHKDLVGFFDLFQEPVNNMQATQNIFVNTLNTIC